MDACYRYTMGPNFAILALLLRFVKVNLCNLQKHVIKLHGEIGPQQRKEIPAMSRGYPETVVNDERFSPRNPPPDKESATARIEDLNDRAVSISTQLDNKKIEDFPDDDSYFRWRSRATSALSHTRAEIEFLERWSNGEVGTSGGKFSKQHDLMSALAEEVRKKAMAIAIEIKEDLPVLYSKKNPPPSLELAKQRSHVLTGARIRLQEAFTAITAEWQSKGLSMKRIQSVKAPLQAVSLDLDIEWRLVKQYLSDSEQSKTRNGRNWIMVLGKALQRAQTEGFSLTDEEKATMNQIQSYM